MDIYFTTGRHYTRFFLSAHKIDILTNLFQTFIVVMQGSQLKSPFLFFYTVSHIGRDVRLDPLGSVVTAEI